MRGVFSIIVFVFLSAFQVSDTADVVTQLRQKFDTFNKNYARVKLDLMFNQPKYSAGDTAKVRTYYVSATDLKPVLGSQIVHLELFDRQGTRVVKNQVLVTNGYSSNDLILPEDLTAGIYLLVAYSDWMRNLDPSLFFKYNFVVTSKEHLLTEVSPRTNLEFYPEGGALINGVENNLLIRLDGRHQKAVTIWQNDVVLTEVAFNEHGLGEFAFTPVANAAYHAEILDGSVKRKFDLPRAQVSGLAMRVVIEASAKIKLTAGPGATTKKYVLVVANRNGIIYSRSVEFNNQGIQEIELPVELPTGIAQVTVLDEEMTQWLNRTILIRSKSTNSVVVNQAKKSYSTREVGSFEVQLSDKLGNPLQGQFSVRIVHDNLFSDPSAYQPGDQLQIYGDIGATFRLRGPANDATINAYLISQSVPWLNWNWIAKEGAKPAKFQPVRTLTVSGKASFVESGKPVPDSTQLMFFLQKEIAGYEVYTHGDGEFECPILFDFAGKDQVFYSATRRGSDLRDVTVNLTNSDSVFDFKAPFWQAESSVDEYGMYSIKKGLINKSFGYFSKKKDGRDSLIDPNTGIEDELQGADMTMKISDYIVFPTMVDLIREVLRSVEYRRIRDRDIIRVYTTGKRPTNDAGPLYVIDGVLTKNASTFLGLKPSEILTIKLIKDSNKLSKFGSLGANGIILVRTKNAAGKAALLQEDSFTLEGISPRSKETAVKNSLNPSVPDLRPCLYWGPNNVTDATGKVSIPFQTSDDVGTFRIEIEGLTSDGTPFTASDSFEVRYNQP